MVTRICTPAFSVPASAEEARRRQQIAADLVERQDDEIGARQVQKRQRAVENAPGELRADQKRDGDEADAESHSVAR